MERVSVVRVHARSYPAFPTHPAPSSWTDASYIEGVTTTKTIDSQKAYQLIKLRTR